MARLPMMARRYKVEGPIEPKKLRAKAFDLLARRDHSEKELEDKLVARGGEKADVVELFKELRDIGLLDDHRFARGFLSCRSGKAWGPRRYRQELLSRGVSGELLEQVLAEAAVSSEALASRKKLRVLMEKELSRGRDAAKIMASMVRRGFDYSEVRQVMETLKSR